MVNYIIRRFLHAIVLLWMISVVVFMVITLPPGDYLSARVAELERQGSRNAQQQLEGLRTRYGLTSRFTCSTGAGPVSSCKATSAIPLITTAR